MSVLTIRPNATGSSAQHSRNGGTSNFGRCSEAASDGDTTYCYNLTTGDGFTQFMFDMYNLANSGGEVGAITLVKVYVVARYAILDSGGVAQLSPGIRVGTTNYFGTLFDLTGGHTAYTAQWATNPAGGNWSWSAINALQGGFRTVCQDGGFGATTEARITQVYVEVTFNRVFVPSSPAVIVVPGLQPDFVHRQRFEPAAPALVPATALLPLFQHHQLFAPEDPALIQVLAAQPGFRHGEPPDRSTPFSLVSQIPDAFKRSDALADFTVETQAVSYIKESRL